MFSLVLLVILGLSVTHIAEATLPPRQSGFKDLATSLVIITILTNEVAGLVLKAQAISYLPSPY